MAKSTTDDAPVVFDDSLLERICAERRESLATVTEDARLTDEECTWLGLPHGGALADLDHNQLVLLATQYIESVGIERECNLEPGCYPWGWCIEDRYSYLAPIRLEAIRRQLGDEAFHAATAEKIAAWQRRLQVAAAEAKLDETSFEVALAKRKLVEAEEASLDAKCKLVEADEAAAVAARDCVDAVGAAVEATHRYPEGPEAALNTSCAAAEGKRKVVEAQEATSEANRKLREAEEAAAEAAREYAEAMSAAVEAARKYAEAVEAERKLAPGP